MGNTFEGNLAGEQSMFGQVATVEAMETIATVTDTHPGATKVIISKSITMMIVIFSKFTLSVSSASQQGAATWYGESCPSTLTSTFRLRLFSGSYSDMQDARARKVTTI